MYSNDTTEPSDIGVTATYQCNKGFKLNGGDTVRTCVDNISTSTGYWNGTAPNCSGMYLSGTFFAMLL